MVTPPDAIHAEVRKLWALKPGICFLNHGSFGAMPIAVQQAQARWRDRIEAEPVEIIARQSERILDQVKEAVGPRFGMQARNFGFVTNATEGINAVLQSLRFEPGDELLTTNHVYHAVRQTMKAVARRCGATCREVAIRLPVESAKEICDWVTGAISDRTRLLVIDHVTSPTALVFPVEQIVSKCREKGIDVLVDGAHVPGMLPLDVEKLGAAYYVANLHKWVCGPRGSAFLWVAADRQERVHPTTISHYLDEGFTKEFNWQGTRDFSAWFAVADALNFQDELGIEKVMLHNHQLAVWAHQLLVERLGVEPISPLDGSLLGSMASVALPGWLSGLEGPEFQAMQQRLHDEFKIEVPLMRWNGQTLLRVSCQVYNTPDEYERLAEVIRKLVG